MKKIKSKIITCIELISTIVNKNESQSLTKLGVNVIFRIYAVTEQSIK